ncbi:MAG: hypothetical protein B6U94_02560 [Thermofilum sp. ex4484_79]|nr:MAG: hypothetical protein B6U94_02560 [Thermofilum sp. ex4484_79]
MAPNNSFERVIPIHALGFFTVCLSGIIKQIVVFEYLDLEEYYGKLIEEGDIDSELEKLASNMQYFLDQEKVFINGKRTRPEVKGIDVVFRGDKTRPSAVFFIEFEGKFKKGVNVYENYYEGGVAPYNFEAYWLFPPNAKIREVLVKGEYEVFGENSNILAIWVKRGQKIVGYERIEFILE